MTVRRVLVVGVGARQHAICWRLANEPGVERVIVAPGNPMMTDVADVHPGVAITDNDALVRLARSAAVDLVVVGPEDPLVAGLADRLAQAGVPCFGPSAAAARLEASKGFARSICDAAAVPMAPGAAFDEPRAAIEYAASLGMPVVIKADGLAGGKGVVICETLAECEFAVSEALVHGRFGHAGRRVVVEAWLAGTEASVFALCDGDSYVLLPAARDHKRACDGDTGPNTGGMGAFSPVPGLDDTALVQIGEKIVAPVLRQMAERGTRFRGALFCGLMLTPHGPRVLEFNVRLGDPEAQAILPRVEGPLAQVMLACANGDVSGAAALTASADATVALALAAAGYPDDARGGDVIRGIDSARAAGALVFGAGVGTGRDGFFTTAGGRVLTVVGRGSDVATAAEHAYDAAAMIEYPGKWYRTDIGRPLVAAGAVA
jgi:phosphoribosylamine--glycine ligase